MVPWEISTSAALVLMKLALLTLIAPVAVAVTLVRLSALVPPVTFTWSIVTGCAKEPPTPPSPGSRSA